MSSPQSGGPDSSFHDRLNRVAEHRAPSDAAKGPVSVLPDWKSRFSGKFGLAIALIVGALAVLVVRVVSYHYLGTAMVSENADKTLAMETGAALALSFVLFTLLPFKGPQYKMMQLAGVLLTISMMHNAVHSAPGLFAAMFSPEWAAEVTSVTEPNSLYLRGEVIHFVKPEPVVEEEKPLPKVRRVG